MVTSNSSREGLLQGEEALDVSPQLGDQALRGRAEHNLAQEIVQEALGPLVTPSTGGVVGSPEYRGAASDTPLE